MGRRWNFWIRREFFGRESWKFQVPSETRIRNLWGPARTHSSTFLPEELRCTEVASGNRKILCWKKSECWMNDFLSIYLFFKFRIQFFAILQKMSNSWNFCYRFCWTHFDFGIVRIVFQAALNVSSWGKMWLNIPETSDSTSPRSTEIRTTCQKWLSRSPCSTSWSHLKVKLLVNSWGFEVKNGSFWWYLWMLRCLVYSFKNCWETSIISNYISPIIELLSKIYLWRTGILWALKSFNCKF